MRFYPIALEALRYAEEIGNKAKNLVHVIQVLGEKAIVKGFVVSANYLMVEKQNVIASEIVAECRKQNICFPVILRSSANVEDSEYSFAGIFESNICNNSNDILKGLNVVCEAAKSERLTAYCEKKRIDVESVKLAIILQQYINADYSGVAFSKHPVTNDRNVILVEYLFENTDGVESGSEDPFEYCIEKNMVTDLKKGNLIFGQLADAVMRLETYFEKPVDVEWAFENGRLLIFQVRPITTE